MCVGGGVWWGGGGRCVRGGTCTTYCEDNGEIKIRFSCEIEDFVENRLCTLCMCDTRAPTARFCYSGCVLIEESYELFLFSAHYPE